MKVEPVAKVAGRNAQNIRVAGGATLEQVAKAAKYYGLAWTTGRVGAFEAGRVSPTLPTLLAVADVLGDVTGRPVSLADLFAGDGRVEITKRLSLPLSAVRSALSGEPVQSTVSDVAGAQEELVESMREFSEQIGQLRIDVTGAELRKILENFSETDLRVARSLGVDRYNAAAAMAKLWRRTFVTERDRRAGPDANAQKKGRVARELKAELKAVLDGNN